MCLSAWNQRPKRPNFLFVMVDELRFPSVYETPELKAWSRENLKAMEELKQTGVEFRFNYSGATACSPARATIFTGQYPSLHGVSQTPGVAKRNFEPDMFWLCPNTVPTLGDYLQAGGYKTFYKGKWHVSDADILIPATQDPWPSYTSEGLPDAEATTVYTKAQRLHPFGFSGWVGPEPHGSSPRDSGASAGQGLSGRDVVFAHEVANLIHELDQDDPWFLVSSFVNPHDITLFGELTAFDPAFNFAVDPTLPAIPPAPTANEDLCTKPEAQTSYKRRYHVGFQPTRDSEKMRKLYYTLQKKVDKDIETVLDALKQSRHKNNTIVIFTSDHGDLLGAHGGLFQKWKVAYEEAIHTPLIFHWPGHFTPHKVDTLTSSVDLFPTILALAGISIPDTMLQLQASHSEVHRPVGKDLSNELYSCHTNTVPTKDVLYFMTDDEPFSGLDSTSLFGNPYPPVREPAHLETVITRINGDLYKYTRYFDNPQFWSSPGDENVLELIEDVKQHGPIEEKKYILITKTTPVADQLEMYNVTQDPLEVKNLATEYKTPESEKIQNILADLLSKQCKLKRLTPMSGPVTGVYKCRCSRARFPRPS